MKYLGRNIILNNVDFNQTNIGATQA
jgi:hypothetical protein